MVVIRFPPPPPPDWKPADSFVHTALGEVIVFPDRENSGEWRVEYADDEGGDCYVIIFGGPAAESRARAYFAALKDGTLSLT